MADKNLLGFTQRRAFKKRVSNSRDRLYRMAFAWTHDPYLADDLVQQTICKALSNQKQLKDLASAEGWLFRILSNCLKDHYRSRRDTVSTDEIVLANHRTPEDESEEQQLVNSVRRAVGQLPLAQCQVITLVDLEGFTYAAVAETLEIPVGTVMSRLCRGRRALREFLEDVRPRERKNQTTILQRVK